MVFHQTNERSLGVENETLQFLENSICTPQYTANCWNNLDSRNFTEKLQIMAPGNLSCHSFKDESFHLPGNRPDPLHTNRESNRYCVQSNSAYHPAYIDCGWDMQGCYMQNLNRFNPSSSIYHAVRTPPKSSNSPGRTPQETNVVFPRRAGPLDSPPSPMAVVVSLDLLNSLRGLPLPLAASAVGLSATAFKKTCRRLGVTRWGYRRGPGRKYSGASPGTAATPPRRASAPSCASSPTPSAGEAVDAELAGVERAEWGWGLAGWLGNGPDGGCASAAAAAAATADDALVLEMLARPWPLNTALPAAGGAAGGRRASAPSGF